MASSSSSSSAIAAVCGAVSRATPATQKRSIDRILRTDLIETIFKFLAPDDIRMCAQTNHSFRQLTINPPDPYKGRAYRAFVATRIGEMLLSKRLIKFPEMTSTDTDINLRRYGFYVIPSNSLTTADLVKYSNLDLRELTRVVTFSLICNEAARVSPSEPSATIQYWTEVVVIGPKIKEYQLQVLMDASFYSQEQQRQKQLAKKRQVALINFFKAKNALQLLEIASHLPLNIQRSIEGRLNGIHVQINDPDLNLDHYKWVMEDEILNYCMNNYLSSAGLERVIESSKRNAQREKVEKIIMMSIATILMLSIVISSVIL